MASQSGMRYDSSRAVTSKYISNLSIPLCTLTSPRVVVPGHVGVRNVKWLTDIKLSAEEAQGPWQRGMSYKGFGPSTKTLDGIDVEAIPSLQEQPVQSAIMTPKTGSIFNPGPNLIQGYAYSGGGRGIVRVDVSSDAGKSWVTASLRSGKEQPLDRAWAWTFWDCTVDIPETTPANSTVQVPHHHLQHKHNALYISQLSTTLLPLIVFPLLRATGHLQGH